MLGISFLLGAFAGATIAFFVIGATKTNRENEIYQEGFLDGKNDKFANEIREIKLEAEKCRKMANKTTNSIDAYGYRRVARAFDTCVTILEKSQKERVEE